MRTAFYSADDNFASPLARGAGEYTAGSNVVNSFDLTAFPNRPTSLFLFAEQDASVEWTATLTAAARALGSTAPLTGTLHERYGVIYLPIVSDYATFAVRVPSSLPSITVNDAKLLRRLHQFEAQPAMGNSKLTLNDKSGFFANRQGA